MFECLSVVLRGLGTRGRFSAILYNFDDFLFASSTQSSLKGSALKGEKFFPLSKNYGK